MDDVLIFGEMKRSSWEELNQILQGFCKATWMIISIGKSIIHYGEGDIEDFKVLGAFFNFKNFPLKVGLSYLGFMMKPTTYSADDWKWLVTKFQKKILS